MEVKPQIYVNHPELGDLVRELNGAPTLYGRALTVELVHRDRVRARDVWREEARVLEHVRERDASTR